MALSQPTYSYTPSLTLVFNYDGDMQSFQLYPDAGIYATMTDVEFNDAINAIMAQIRILCPTGSISCDVNWINNGSGSSRVTYTG